MNRKHENKITIVGQARVGKSSIVNRIYKNCFNDHESSTIGAAFCATKYKSKLLQFWDTAGQERFQALVPMYLRHSKIVLVVYDMTSTYSFENIKQHWINFIKESSPESDIIIIGNKYDLRQHRKTNIKECTNFADSIGATYIETSAKTNYNIEKLLDIIIDLLDTQSTSISNNPFDDDYTTTSSVNRDDVLFGDKDPSLFRNRCFNCNFI